MLIAWIVAAVAFVIGLVDLVVKPTHWDRTLAVAVIVLVLALAVALTQRRRAQRY